MSDNDSNTANTDEEALWYVIHTYSGYENKVKQNLEHRIESMDMRGSIFHVVVPTEEEIEIKNGQRRTVNKKVFPGYVLVQMKLTDDSWYVVRNTPGLTEFIAELLAFPAGRHDDQVDALALVGQLLDLIMSGKEPVSTGDAPKSLEYVAGPDGRTVTNMTPAEQIAYFLKRQNAKREN